MHRPDVDRMMASMTAREYKEWEAYERATGPLDSQYEREVFAQLHELIQFNNQLTGAAVTGKGKKNPAGKFRKVPRPHQTTDPYAELDEDDEPNDDEIEEDWDDDDLEEGESGQQYEADPNTYDPSKDPFANW